MKPLLNCAYCGSELDASRKLILCDKCGLPNIYNLVQIKDGFVVLDSVTVGKIMYSEVHGYWLEGEGLETISLGRASKKKVRTKLLLYLSKRVKICHCEQVYLTECPKCTSR